MVGALKGVIAVEIIVVVAIEVVIIAVVVVVLAIVVSIVVVSVVVVVVIVVATSDGHGNALKTCCEVMTLRRRAMPGLNVREREKTPKMSTSTWKVSITIEEILQERSEFIVV